MGRLLERDASVLIVIDAQPRFLAGDATSLVDGIVARVGWLVGVAAALDVPIVVTEEAPERNGATHPDIAARLPAGTPVLVKPTFGLAAVPAILAAVEAIGRDTAVLVGMETDVCVAQSALGLLDHGRRVAVVADATYSPGAMHDHGLRRIADAGGVVVHAKGLYYEWVRTVDAALAFERAHPDLATPPGFSL
jgi:nicotinamidase-related amidase